MAEPRSNGEKQGQIPEVPTRITAAQVIAVILTLAAIRAARGVLAPLLIAVLVAIALAPMVRVMSRVIPRWISSAIVVLAIAGSIGTVAWVLSDEIAAFSRRLPGILRDVRNVIQSSSPRQSLVRQLQQAVSELEQTTATAKPQNATPVTIVESTDVQRQVMTYARSGAGWLGSVILLFFLIYFLLASGDMFKEKFVRLSGQRLSQRKVTVQMIDEITTQVGQFIFYQFWSGLLVGLLTWAAFAWLGMRYAGLWGVAAGVLNWIPYFGPTIILVVSMTALVGGVSVVITALEGFLLAPIALGRAARVNAVAIFVAVMFGGWMWGPAGMILAVPVLMMIKTVADHVESLSSLSELLGDRTSPARS
jgi:predicted PurR-regulated permease PerM